MDKPSPYGSYFVHSTAQEKFTQWSQVNEHECWTNIE